MLKFHELWVLILLRRYKSQTVLHELPLFYRQTAASSVTFSQKVAKSDRAEITQKSENELTRNGNEQESTSVPPMKFMETKENAEPLDLSSRRYFSNNLRKTTSPFVIGDCIATRTRLQKRISQSTVGFDEPFL